MISSNGSWDANTNYICRKASKRCWLLLRLKKLGASRKQLMTVYERQVRSTLEMAVPAWHSSLSIKNKNKIERQQKKAFTIILGSQYKNYKDSLISLNQDTLQERRQIMTLKFAKKCLKDPRHQDMFPILDCKRPGTRQRKTFKEYQCRTKRFYNSALPFMTRTLNQE